MLVFTIIIDNFGKTNLQVGFEQSLTIGQIAQHQSKYLGYKRENNRFWRIFMDGDIMSITKTKVPADFS